MAKGSQLAQLKSALSNAGITKPPENSKKRKRSQNEEKDRVKRAERLHEIHQKLNPFDVKVTKVKKDVGGRKLKGVTGRPAQSKQAGMEQRKKTLLKEFQDRSHAGGIIDRRFGENDPTMTPEERMLECFTKERQRASKGVSFNLEEEDELTHYGQSLSNLDDFDNSGLTLEDDDEVTLGQIDGATVKHAHFGGFEDDDADTEDPERKKTKAEVMAEVIAKSKEHKMQRQIERERDNNIRHELDQELDSIRSLLLQPDALSLSLEKSSGLGIGDAADKDQQYDQFVRELVFDKRARPKDRLKTEEELATEEKERLEQAERRRLRRMNGEDDDSSDDDTRRKRKRPRGGDDLEDDFTEAQAWDDFGEGLQEDGGLDGGMLDATEDDVVESDEDSASNGEESDWDDEPPPPKQHSSQINADDGNLGEVKGERPHKRQRTLSTQELPFTFTCPRSHEEFLEILVNIADDDVPTVVQRIRTLHHPSLGADNKFKLQEFCGVLIDHVLYATSSSPRISLVASLVPHIYALTKAYPVQAAEHFVQKLSIMSKNLKHGVSRGASRADSKTWPDLPELIFLRTIAAIWPTSDMNHAVISPTRLLMGSYLALCRVRNLQDLGRGLFLCTLFFQFEHLSRRVVPEVINFLINALLHLSPHSFATTQALPGAFPSPDFGELNIAVKTEAHVLKTYTPQAPNLNVILSSHDDSNRTKMDLLGLAVDLLSRFAQGYKDLDGFKEIFQPAVIILTHVDASKFSKDFQKTLNDVISVLTRLIKFSVQARQPLRLQAHKAIPIPSYIPKFESSSSSYLRAQDPDHEKNEASKLRRQYKQERKGAIRELRKDARFLATVEQERQKDKDQAYAASMKRVLGSIEGERAEQKAMEREKAKEKRRAGRK